MLIIGIISGIIGTVFGLGGGTVTVPILTLQGFSIHNAITMSLLCILSRSLFSNILFLRENRINIPLGLSLVFTTLIASYFGAKISLVTYAFFIKILFAISILILSFGMLRLKSVNYNTNTQSFFYHSYIDNGTSISYVPTNIVSAMIISSLAGFLGGMLGIGGGSILVPIMVSLCKVPIKVAITTSSFIISFLVLPALLVYTKAINIAIIPSLALIIGAVIGTYIGKTLLLKIKNTHLSIFFILFTILIAVIMIYSAYTT